jgi:hypothetical protein
MAGEVVEKVVQIAVYYIFTYAGFSRMRLILSRVILEKPAILQKVMGEAVRMGSVRWNIVELRRLSTELKRFPF